MIPSNVNSSSVDFDAESMDTIDDICREVIAKRLKHPDAQAIERILSVVRDCMNEVQQRGLMGEQPNRQSNAAVAVLDLIGNSTHPRLTVRCLRFVFNLEESSQTEIAEEFGLTRAAVSRICVSLADRLGVAPSRGMRTLQAREAYRERAKQHPHQRRERSFAFQSLLEQQSKQSN